MLSLFPELFDWSFLVPTILRITLGGYLLVNGYRMYKSTVTMPNKEDRLSFCIMGAIVALVGGALFIGIWTQAAAAIAVALGIIALYLKQNNSLHAPQTRAFYIFATAIALSLIFLGAGAYAVDLPL